MSLDEIGLKYGTDKASNGHNYLHVYEQIMPSVRPVNLLEIGWFDGASMRTWKDYLHPDSVILGVDIVEKDDSGFPPGVYFVHGDATKYELLEKLDSWIVTEDPFLDFIIDDGSHLSPDVIASLMLLWPLVAPGGYYIVEDLHVSYHKGWLGSDDAIAPGPRGTTSMQFLKLLTDAVHYRHAGAGPSQPVLPDVASIAFYPGLAIIQKKS